VASDNQLLLTVKAKDEASATLKRVRGETKEFSEGVDRSMTAASRSSDRGSDVTRKALLGVSVALGATSVALTAFAKKATTTTVQYVGNINRLSREIGENTKQTSALIYAGQRLGLTADEASVSFGMLSKQISDARKSAKEHALEQAELNNKIAATKIKIADLTAEQRKNGDKTGELRTKIQGLNIDLQKYQEKLKDSENPLQRLGVATQKADGSSRSFSEILLDLSDKFKAMPNGAEKSALAMELFGRSGKDLIPLLNKGSSGIKDLTAQAEKLGLTLNPQTAAQVQAYVAAQKQMNDQMQVLQLRVGTETIPVLTRFQERLNGMVGTLITAPEPIKSLTTNILAFGGPVAGAAAGVTGFAANLAGAMPLMDAMNTKVPALGGAFRGLGAFLSNPWTLVVAGVVVGIVLLLAKTGELKGVVEQTITTWNRLQASLATLQPELAKLNQNLKDLKPTIDVIKAVLSILAHIIGSEIVDNIKFALGWIDGFVKFSVAAANKIAGAWKAVQDAIRGVVEGGKIAFQALANPGSLLKGRIPGFATGVENFRGGLAVVGERGPELVSLPRGANVYSNEESQHVAGVTINQTNHIHNQVDMDAANRELGWRLASV
jgi:hypothetical protein